MGIGFEKLTHYTDNIIPGLNKVLKKNNCYSKELFEMIVKKRIASKEECFEHLNTQIIPMLNSLKERGIKKLKVVFSTEEAITPGRVVSEEGRRATPGSVAFVPSVAGLIIAGEVIKDITNG